MTAIEVISEAIDAYDVLGDSWGLGAKARVRLADLEALVTAAEAITRDPEFPGRGPLTITRGQKEALAAAVARVKGGSDG